MKPYKPVLVMNDYTKEFEMICPATIVKMPKKARSNANDTEYYQAAVLINMPNGDEVKDSTTIWAAIEDSTGFEPGDEIEIAFQTVGKYKGFSKLYLGKQDKSSILSGYDAAIGEAFEDIKSTKPVKEGKIKNKS